MSPSRFASLVIVCVASASSSLAMAQQPASSSPASPPAVGQPAPVAPKESLSAPTDNATAAPASAAPTPAEAPASKEEGETRFRWGISGYGGPLAGGLSGGAGGIDVRFGAQITNLVGVYGQPVLLLGAGAAASENNVSASGVAVYGLGALVEVTPIDMVYIALGPELLHGGMASTEVTTAGGSAAASTGPYLSGTARAGLALGSMKPNRRKAFTLGLDFRAILSPGDPVLVPCLALGYDSF